MRWLAAAFQWQSRAVVERHLRVHLRNWHTAFLPPALEPVTNLLAFGAILRITPEAILAARASEGARTVAALAASYHGPVLKVSQDGVTSMYLGGRRVWEL